MTSRNKKKQNRRNFNHNLTKSRSVQNPAVIQQTTATFKSGPLPTPEDLQKYAEISPELVNRIVLMAEKQQAHRHYIEKKDQKIIPFLYVFGQFFGFILAISVLIGGIFLIYNNKKVDGFAVLVGGAITLAGIYVFGKKKNKEHNSIQIEEEK